ncbi:MAG: TraR/DksA family transcriptional regulator [Patescibacteria group bacterium]
MDVGQQRQRIQERLQYYEEMFRVRDEAYCNFKRRFIIPRLLLALQKIGDGTYGVCDVCGDDISEARLELIPGALRCTACQSLTERRF